MSNRVRIDVVNEDIADRHGSYWFVSMASCQGNLRLSAWIVNDDLGRTSVVGIFQNDGLLPEQLAHCILLKLHALYWPSVRCDCCAGIATGLDLDEFLHQHLAEQASEILATFRRAIKTFQS